MSRKGRFVLAAAIVTMGFATGSGSAQTSATTSTAPIGIWARMNETVDTAYTRAGDKISAVLQDDTAVNDIRLPKGTKLTGTIVKSVKQDKQHPNSGVVLLFDTAVLKSGATVPVHVAIASLSPSLSDKIEQVTAGSGDITDASLAAGVIEGGMDDPNKGVTAHSGTTVNGIRATSNIKGVVLFASPNSSSSGVIVARTGPLQLNKWTQINVVVTPR